VRDAAALGEIRRMTQKAHANWRLEASTLRPSLAIQASIPAIVQLQNSRVGRVAITSNSTQPSTMRHDLIITTRSIKADPFQGRVNFLQRFLAKVRDAEQIVTRTIQQVMYRKDPAFLKAIRRSDREANLGRAHLQPFMKATGRFLGSTKRNACHGFPPT
jgi:hypothetical protein